MFFFLIDKELYKKEVLKDWPKVYNTYTKRLKQEKELQNKKGYNNIALNKSPTNQRNEPESKDHHL